MVALGQIECTGIYGGEKSLDDTHRHSDRDRDRVTHTHTHTQQDRDS